MSTTTKTSSPRSASIGFSGLLTILFIALKLTGHITWSWLWVLSPLWIGLALVVAIMVIVFIVGIVIAYLSK